MIKATQALPLQCLKKFNMNCSYKNKRRGGEPGIEGTEAEQCKISRRGLVCMVLYPECSVYMHVEVS